MNDYNTFDQKNHLLTEIEKVQFETLNGWDFGWALLEPIDISTDDEGSELELANRLSPGQKALYFFWYLDAQVTNGGFIQFYWNNYRKYIKPIKIGLQLIQDNQMLE